MAVKQVKVFVNDLRMDMYVSGLDRPWSATSFPLQGFYIRSQEDIDQLCAVCKFVYIDVTRGASPVKANLKTLDKSSSLGGGLGEKGGLRTRDTGPKLQKLPLRKDSYDVAAPLKKELKKVDALMSDVGYAVSEVMSQVESGVPMSYGEIRQAADGMVGSVVRNPDALTWLMRMQEKDEYTHDHAVRCAVWALLFARHAGMQKADMQLLTEAVLLKDVGKIKLPKELLTQEERTPAQEKEYEKFVDYSVEILRETGGVSPKVVSIVKNHCELINGKGFPRGLEGDKIPFLAKVTGIVSVYDQITNPRYSNYPLAPSKAVSQLYKMRNEEFQEELVVEFIQAIGLYPTGTVVELSTGETAVVVEQNFGRRLKPKVMIVRDVAGDPLEKPKLVDMALIDQQRQELLDKGKREKADQMRIDVIRDVEPNIADVDVHLVLQDYLKAQKKSLLGFLGR